MMNRFDRRAFLRVAAAASTLPLVGPRRSATATPSSTDSTNTQSGGRRVVVLGAGLAGLCAAFNLMNYGYDVTVLEAQDRPGGRVQTARDGFQSEGYAELGAVRIPDTHEYTLKYVDKFGLDLTPYDNGARVFYMQDKRFLAPPEGEPWPLPGLAADEQPDPSARLPQYLESGFEKLGDISDPGWPGTEPSAIELDSMTIDDYMSKQGASPTWRDWFYAQNGRIARMNAAVAFATESLPPGDVIAGIKGGTDRLPVAFAAALEDRVKYLSEVVGIAQNRDGVTVSFIDPTGQHQLRADRCVCVLPFAPLRRVQLVDADFSQGKMDAIDKLEYMPAARCHFQTKTRFWQNDPLGPLGGLNLVGTDTMAGRVWNTSSQQPDQMIGMVHAYMFDTEALEFASYGDQRERAMTRLFQTLLPGIDDQIVGVAHKAWQEDPWVGGGWGWAQPEDLRWMLPAMRRPEGRVHFAGDHTSVWIAWMNGALESAERVVEEVLNADA